jgi:hypothetical protein
VRVCERTKVCVLRLGPDGAVVDRRERRQLVHLCVSVCVRESEGESVCECVCERVGERVCESVCARERVCE